MKTINEVTQKVKGLKRKLKVRYSLVGLYENFGQAELHELHMFIGSVYDYPYESTQRLITITNDFFNWCINYTGEK